jgi:aryl-alcohol dehydrogenase-like predicted oxidoreductase
MIALPQLGVGTWQWGDRRIWGYGRSYGEAEVRGAFGAAIDAGLRFFDTAELYGGGESERLLGRCLRDTSVDVRVATKFFPFPWRLAQRGSLLRALRNSLQRVGLERVTLYQIHWPLPLVPADLWADELAEAVRSGLTEAVGVSNYGVRNLQRMYKALRKRDVPLAANQIEYSLLQRTPEHNGVLRACRELDVTVIAYSPLARGLLGGRYSPHNPPSGFRVPGLKHKLRQAAAIVPALREIGSAHGDRTPAQVALNWLISHEAVPIPGAKSAVQARENAGALGWRLSVDEVDRLDRLSSV